MPKRVAFFPAPSMPAGENTSLGFQSSALLCVCCRSLRRSSRVVRQGVSLLVPRAIKERIPYKNRFAPDEKTTWLLTKYHIPSSVLVAPMLAALLSPLLHRNNYLFGLELGSKMKIKSNTSALPAYLLHVDLFTLGTISRIDRYTKSRTEAGLPERALT